MKHFLTCMLATCAGSNAGFAQIQNILVETAIDSATISWSMSTPAIPSLDYGPTAAYELGTLGGGGSVLVPIDFEDISVPVDDDIDAADFVSKGFAFDISNDHSNFANGTLTYPPGPASNSGSTFFFLYGHYLNGWVNPSVTMTSDLGLTFDLIELRLSEYVLWADAAQVEIVGTYPSGSTVTKTVFLDGVLDGAGGADDFQLVEFDGAWSSLESVRFTGSGGTPPRVFAIEDILVEEIVPLQDSAQFDLVGLSPATTYHFRARAVDGGGQAVTVENTFTTSSTGAGNPPAILGHQISTTDLTATLEWSTDQLTLGSLVYGLTDQHELGALSTTVSSQTIDFEDQGVPQDSELDLGDFASGGFDFDISDDESTFINGEVFYGASPGSYNGSTYLYIYGSYNGGWGYPTATLTDPSGATFSLHSLDYSEAAPFSFATKMVVTGQTVGGETLRETFFLDGITDGAGGVEDFETAVFDATWVDLVSVDIQAEDGAQGALLAIDNIVLNEQSNFALDHSFLLEGLTHGTEYHTRLIATDADGDVTTTGDLTFTTTSVDDHDPPVISNILVVSELGSAIITWITDELAQSVVDFGLTSNYGVVHSTAAPTLETIDFEDITVPQNDDIDLGDFTSGGFLFDISSDHSNFGNNKPGWNHNGSTYFFVHGFYSQGWIRPTITMTPVSGGTFSLEQLDVGEVIVANVEADVVRVTGTKTSGAQVVRDITVDKILDGPDGEEDFQTEVFDVNWTELVSLQFQGVAGPSYRQFSLDNIVILDTSALSKAHSVALTNLGVNLIYHYQVSAVDEAGNTAADGDHTFVSGQTNDAAPPTISNLVVTPTSDSATVTWETNEWAEGFIFLGQTQSLELGQLGGNTSGVVNIDFEQNFDAVGLAPIVIPADDDVDAGDFVSSNYLFDIDDDHSNFLNGEVLFLGDPVSYNGTTLFFVHGHYDNGWVYPVVEVTSLQSTTFSLVQMDVSEATSQTGQIMANAEQVRFRGTRLDGSTVEQLHDFDLVVDGSGPLNDFETVTFDAEWEDLTLLTMQVTEGLQEAEAVYDNIVVRQGGGVSHSVVATGLAPNTTYYFEVTAVDAGLNQTVSGILTFTTLP